MNRDVFSTYHPLVNFVYFSAVIGCSMVFMHPALQAIALFSAALYAFLLKGRKAVSFQLVYMLPLLLLMALINPLFNHAGVTILMYLPDGNPLTYESILYGAAAACMYVTIIVWFSCFNAVMTSDKIIYLFGKLWPASSLILTMSLRFVPRYLEQIKVIGGAQTCIGRDASQGSLLDRARSGIRILSIMTTWALENAIETADAMKSRGYGLPGRTSFSLYRFDRRDQAASLILLALLALVGAGAWDGQNTIRFFPSVRMHEVSVLGLAAYIAFGVLCLLPVIMRAVEEVKWNYFRSTN